jgi:ribonuclease T2
MRFFLLLLFGVAAAAQQSQPGKFDYYILTLSWSPEYCHTNPTNVQCTGAKHFGFVVHGLWPEFQTGGGPQNCPMQPGLANPATMLDIMPDLHLIAHEWATHGTCSGLSADAYFGLIRTAFTSIRIPPQFANAHAAVTMTSEQIKQAFEQSNPSWKDANLAVSCPSGYLSAVEVCLTKTLNPTACTAIRTCTSPSVRVPPLR